MNPIIPSNEGIGSTKAQIVRQYLLLIAFVVIIVFAPLGRSCLYYELHGIAGSSVVDIDTDMALGVGACIAIVVVTIVEGIVLHFQNKATCVIGIISCVFRLAYPVLLVLFDTYASILNAKLLTVDLTVFTYLLLVMGIASLVYYSNRIKQIRSLANSQNNCRGAEQEPETNGGFYGNQQ